MLARAAAARPLRARRRTRRTRRRPPTGSASRRQTSSSACTKRIVFASSCRGPRRRSAGGAPWRALATGARAHACVRDHRQRERVRGAARRGRAARRAARSTRLRDGAGIFRLAVFAPRRRAVRRRASRPRRSLARTTSRPTCGALATLLRRNNFLPSWVDVPPRGDDDGGGTCARRSPRTHPRGAPGLLPGERAVAGREGLARTRRRARHGSAPAAASRPTSTAASCSPPRSAPRTGVPVHAAADRRDGRRHPEPRGADGRAVRPARPDHAGDVARGAGRGRCRSPTAASSSTSGNARSRAATSSSAAACASTRSGSGTATSSWSMPSRDAVRPRAGARRRWRCTTALQPGGRPAAPRARRGPADVLVASRPPAARAAPARTARCAPDEPALVQHAVRRAAAASQPPRPERGRGGRLLRVLRRQPGDGGGRHRLLRQFARDARGAARHGARPGEARRPVRPGRGRGARAAVRSHGGTSRWRRWRSPAHVRDQGLLTECAAVEASRTRASRCCERALADLAPEPAALEPATALGAASRG